MATTKIETPEFGEGCASFLLRFFIGTILLLILFFYADPVDVTMIELDMVNEILVLSIAMGYIIFTMIICFSIGVLLRFKKTGSWWRSRPWLQLGGLVVGCIIIVISLQPTFRITGERTTEIGRKEIYLYANQYISFTGWYITSFFLLNIYPSDILRKIYYKKQWDSGV